MVHALRHAQNARIVVRRGHMEIACDILVDTGIITKAFHCPGDPRYQVYGKVTTHSPYAAGPSIEPHAVHMSLSRNDFLVAQAEV